MSSTLTPEQMARVLNALVDTNTLRAGLLAAGFYLKGRLSEYPPARDNKPKQPFVTDKSRRYFFYALKAGLIDVPYVRGASRRSETFGKRWAVVAVGDSVLIGNRASYAPFLVGVNWQSRYMRKLGWRTVHETTRREKKETAEQFTLGMYQRIRSIGA